VTDAAVFVDRDGVLNELVADPATGCPESPLAVDDVVMIDGAASALRRLSNAGWRLVGVSNQPAAAKGRVPLSDLHAVHGRVIELLDAEGVRFDSFQICLHHPYGVTPALSGVCDCRKPAPGMLLTAAADLAIDLAASWMVGDTDADVQAGRSAGVRTILVEHPGSAHKRSGRITPDLTVDGLATAADRILSMEGVD
jgi:D-glycero-D-manno-heptose 1,7-bisphosphate phosphatase